MRQTDVRRTGALRRPNRSPRRRRRHGGGGQGRGSRHARAWVAGSGEVAVAGWDDGSDGSDVLSSSPLESLSPPTWIGDDGHFRHFRHSKCSRAVRPPRPRPGAPATSSAPVHCPAAPAAQLRVPSQPCGARSPAPRRSRPCPEERRSPRSLAFTPPSPTGAAHSTPVPSAPGEEVACHEKKPNTARVPGTERARRPRDARAPRPPARQPFSQARKARGGARRRRTPQHAGGFPMTLRGYRTDPLLDVVPHATPIPAGHVIVGGLSARGLPAARVVVEREAPRLRRIAAEHRQRAADRRRLVAIIDDPDHAAESAELLDRVNAPARARRVRHTTREALR